MMTKTLITLIRPDGPKISKFRWSPIRVFPFVMVSLDHGKRRTCAVSFETALISAFKELPKMKIF